MNGFNTITPGGMFGRPGIFGNVCGGMKEDSEDDDVGFPSDIVDDVMASSWACKSFGLPRLFEADDPSGGAIPWTSCLCFLR